MGKFNKGPDLIYQNSGAWKSCWTPEIMQDTTVSDLILQGWHPSFPRKKMAISWGSSSPQFQAQIIASGKTEWKLRAYSTPREHAITPGSVSNQGVS